MKSKTPTWAIIVAILMMLIGGCGIKNDIQSINIRSMLDLKDKIFENIETKAKKSNEVNKEIDVNDEVNDASDPDSNKQDTEKTDAGSLTSISDSSNAEDTISDAKDTSNRDMKSVKDMFGSMLDLQESTIKKMIAFGYIGLIFSFLLVLGGVFLLIKKSFSIKLAYAVLGANMLFSLTRWVMLSGEGGTLLALGNSLGAAFSIFTCIILVVVIVSSDKSHYEEVYTDG